MADEKATETKATETHETPDGGTETTTHSGTKDENLVTEEETATTEANQI